MYKLIQKYLDKSNKYIDEKMPQASDYKKLSKKSLIIRIQTSTFYIQLLTVAAGIILSGFGWLYTTNDAIYGNLDSYIIQVNYYEKKLRHFYNIDPILYPDIELNENEKILHIFDYMNLVLITTEESLENNKTLEARSVFSHAKSSFEQFKSNLSKSIETEHRKEFKRIIYRTLLVAEFIVLLLTFYYFHKRSAIVKAYELKNENIRRTERNRNPLRRPSFPTAER